ncbi:ATP-binding cassette domain-containing protein [Saccharopolyspora rhizosphaerae]|uniref:ATP-binding cassette domain-containing protein n=1 Tax=Saccharopolyspora rhizosphaerae TaxID=2492662 RepID=A0A3R8QQX5_9PSEU|nr:ATP-binding cassette domain-containing protein [Saccharopolyspora rhizosphaerae]RRO17628.1 ATP-binding cassette domain-containing protein [Saccharopolyspora rhizosphaerae]
MEIVATGVEVIGAHGPLLAPTSLRVSDGQALLVTGDAGTGRTALALALSGRLKPSAGSVRLDGSADPDRLRRTVAVVDAPQITEPDDALQVRDVVAEGLSLAGRSSTRRRVRAWLAERELPADVRFENLAAHQRTRLLIDLACESRTTRALVLDCPDRHGDDPQHWYSQATARAAAGMAVVALCSTHSAEKLDVPAVRISADDTDKSTSAG